MNGTYTSDNVLIATHIEGAFGVDETFPAGNVIGTRLLVDLLKLELSVRGLFTDIAGGGELNHAWILVGTADWQETVKVVLEVLKRFGIPLGAAIFTLDRGEGIFRSVHPSAGGACLPESLVQAAVGFPTKNYSAFQAEIQAVMGLPRKPSGDTPSQ